MKLCEALFAFPLAFVGVLVVAKHSPSWVSNENRKSMGMIRYSSEIENQILGELESKQQYGTAI